MRAERRPRGRRYALHDLQGPCQCRRQLCCLRHTKFALEMDTNCGRVRPNKMFIVVDEPTASGGGGASGARAVPTHLTRAKRNPPICLLAMHTRTSLVAQVRWARTASLEPYLLTCARRLTSPHLGRTVTPRSCAQLKRAKVPLRARLLGPLWAFSGASNRHRNLDYSNDDARELTRLALMMRPKVARSYSR